MIIFSNPARFLFVPFLLLAFTGNGNANTTLKLAHVAHPESSIGVGAQRFADNLHEISNGKMQVEILPRGTMGGIRDIFVQMQAGAVDMQTIDISAMTLLKDAKQLNVMVTPFLFRDQPHLRKFLGSDLFADMLVPVLKKTGIRYVGVVSERSPRVISTTRKPVAKVEDVKGLKIRVPQNSVFVETFKNWGANPTPIKGADMFMALKTGMVDGEDNGVMNLVAGSNKKVIKHFTPINWNRSGVGAWISETTWQSFSEQEKDWIQRASLRSSEQAATAYDDDLSQSMGELKEFGITVHEPELDGFLPATKQVVEKFEGDLWPSGLVAEIQSIK